ncbi:hypothetical protein [Candidatus Binatus sp.]|uniref:hypothetical protein n=1 Tax=Candidatus Binatus sp. TaxID=2811406 RepID=UPI00272BF35B|nr:hypothetical protein [Candidatus Binatus sp.]
MSNPIWGWLSLTIAAVYSVIWPGWRDAHPAPHPFAICFVLRWFHAITWILLAASFFIRSSIAPSRTTLANAIAPAAMLCYVAFIATFAYFRTTQVGREQPPRFRTRRSLCRSRGQANPCGVSECAILAARRR